MTFFIYLFKGCLKFTYFFLKFLPTKENKITFLSRQSNEPSNELRTLKETFEKEDNEVEIVILSKKIERGLLNYFKYFLHIFQQMYHIATSKVCILESYIIPISILNHKKNLKVMQIWHSMIMIKAFGYMSVDKYKDKLKANDIAFNKNNKIANLMCMHKNYDKIVSTSNEMVKYFSIAFNQPKDKFLCFGSPKIDYLLNTQKEIKNRLLSKYPNLKEKINILYAPTFRSYSAVNIEDIINTFNSDKYNLIIKRHPLDLKRNSHSIWTDIYEEENTASMLTIADYVITDYSGISVEAAVLNKKVCFYCYDHEEYNANVGIVIDTNKYFPNISFSNTKEILDCIENENYDYNEFLNFKNKFIDNQQGNSSKLIIEYIKNNWL